MGAVWKTANNQTEAENFVQEIQMGLWDRAMASGHMLEGYVDEAE